LWKLLGPAVNRIVDRSCIYTVDCVN
jgi:hypothetical protein